MRGLFAVLLVAFLTACNSGPETATALYFSEQEPGGEPFPTRMIITAKYLRIDYGVDDDDFILFDRKNPTIYSVNRNDKTVMVITPEKIAVPPPQPLAHRVEKDSKNGAPPVGGKAVNRYRLFTNDKPCYDLFTAAGLLPQAVAALREYHQAMAGEHAAALVNTPQELQSACDLANFIFAPTRHLEYGFPVRQQDMTGNVRQLRDYKQDYIAAEELFRLPADFRRYQPRALPGDNEDAAAGDTSRNGDAALRL